MEVDIYDIFNGIKNVSESGVEFKYNLKEVFDHIHHNKDILDKLWNDYCNDNDLCTYCGKPLRVRVDLQQEEYQGIPVNMPIYTRYCDDCGET